MTQSQMFTGYVLDPAYPLSHVKVLWPDDQESFLEPGTSQSEAAQ